MNTIHDLRGRIHFSELKLMAISPMRFKHAIDCGRQVQPDTAWRRFGTAVDTMLLGGDFAVWPGTRRGNAWEKFAEAHAGVLILTEKERAEAAAAVKSLQSRPHAMALLEGERQRAIEWTWCGRECGGTPDIINPGRYITDLKTARTAQPERLRRACLHYAYHAQHRFYGLGAELAGLGTHRHFIVALESVAPYDVVCLELTPRALLEGEKLCRIWMEQVLGCEASNDWPGYAQTVLPLDVDEDAELIFDDPETGEEAA
jgi:hypothetical protein